METRGKLGNTRNETDLENDEMLANFSDQANNLTSNTTAVKYTGMTNFLGFRVHELLLLAGIIVLGSYLAKRYLNK